MMRKVLIGAGVICLVAALGLLIYSFTQRSSAGLIVQTEPESTVFLDSAQIGTTPFEIKRKAGEVLIKLVPFSQNSALTTYETKVTLNSGIATVLRRSFGATDELSAGDILSFEKIGGKQASLSIVSAPDAVQIEIDGSASGFTPLKLDAIAPGSHTVRLMGNGFAPREIPIKVETGYRLTIVARLAKLENVQESQEAVTPQAIKQVLVEILSTPTGFLRVRSDASTAASESARVTPGKKYPFVEEKQRWYKIEFETGKQGWVTSEYAKKIEE